MIKLTQQEFIGAANLFYNFKYDYSITKYINRRTNINVICKNHGIFIQKASNHLRNVRGCIGCFNEYLIEKSKIIENNKNNFINIANILYDSQYDYSKIDNDYISNKSKITIICKIHNIEFLQIAERHLNGFDCKKCYNIRKFTKIFINKSNKKHNNVYDYSKVNYTDSDHEVIIICKKIKHGEFLKLPQKHINGSGCPKCLPELRRNISCSSTEEFIKKSNIIHNSKEIKYNYSMVSYFNSFTKVKIICNKKHGVFLQTPNAHLSGHGCQKCFSSSSKSEIRWLNSLNIPENFRNQTIKLGNKWFRPDAIDKENNISYEMNGDFIHGNPATYNSEDENTFLHKTFGELYQKTLEKEKVFKEAGYQVISSWESDFRNMETGKIKNFSETKESLGDSYWNDVRWKKANRLCDKQKQSEANELALEIRKDYGIKT